MFVFRKTIVNLFHKVFYRSPDLETWRDARWLGVRTLKCPFDLWVYQEIIVDLQPDVIIESGTYRGGSAFFLASVCDQVGRGRIITIDHQAIADPPQHPRIVYIHGASTDSDTVRQVEGQLSSSDRVMVVLDSDHHKAHVLREMQIYSNWVSIGAYLIVEDTNINGHPVWPDFGPGPMEAVAAFLQQDDRFVVDRQREKFFLTFNPGGYLKRIK